MTLGGFSSLIQLFGAFFFGFIGLNFLNDFYVKFNLRINKEEKSIKEQVKTFSNDEIFGIHHQLEHLENLKNKIRLVYDQRFKELFLKGGIYSFFLLFYIGLESQNGMICFSFLGTSIFFILNTIFRIRFLFSRNTLHNVENIAASATLHKNYFEIKPLKLKDIYDFLFNSYIIHYNFKRDLKNRFVVFCILLLIVFHIPIIFNYQFYYFENFFNHESFLFISIIISLFSLMFPYILLFLADSLIFLKVRDIRNVITEKISQHNMNELFSWIEKK